MATFIKNVELTPKLCTLTDGQKNAILAIIQNSNFITSVARTTKQARDYYNNDKKWCVAYTFTNIKDMGKKRLTLTLRQSHYNLHPLANHTEASKYVENAVNINDLLHYGPKNDREAVFYFYYKHKDFFIRILTALKWSIVSNATDKYYCHKVHLPGDLDWEGSFGIKNHERIFMLTGKDILTLYGKMLTCNNFDQRCKINGIGETYVMPCLPPNLATIQGARGGIPLYQLPKPNPSKIAQVIDKALMNFEVGRFNYRNSVKW